MNAEMFNAPASFTNEPVAQPVAIKEKKRYIYPPEKIREYNKRMYEKNKEKERYECPICFGVYTYYNKAHHTHTDIHLRAIKFLEDQKQKKMNPPTLDTQIKGKVVYLDMDHYCHECKDFFQEDEVHLCTGHPQAPSKISIGEEVKEDVLINGTLE